MNAGARKLKEDTLEESTDSSKRVLGRGDGHSPSGWPYRECGKVRRQTGNTLQDPSVGIPFELMPGGSPGENRSEGNPRCHRRFGIDQMVSNIEPMCLCDSEHTQSQSEALWIWLVLRGILTTHNHLEEVAGIVSLQDCLDPVSIFRRDNGQPEPPGLQLSERSETPIEEFGLRHHDSVGMLNEEFSETDSVAGIAATSEGFQRSF